MSKKQLFIKAISLIVALGGVGHLALAHCVQEDKVCYFIVSDTSDSVMRTVDILLDEEDFTEPKLRSLMTQFRTKYSEPNMIVMLFSKVERYNQSRMGHASLRTKKTYAEGVLIYRENDLIIRFKKSSESDLQTVVVQGKDSFK
ncbi:MAG: hypothetical protein AB1757_20030 [Acidobacteriota bacterium]